MHNHDHKDNDQPNIGAQNEDEHGAAETGHEDLEFEAEDIDGLMAGVGADLHEHGSDSGSDVDPAQQQIETLLAELDKTKDQMMRALAEAENTRRRSIKDREDVRKYAVSEFARDLLDFSDNFGRALGSIPPELMDLDERLKNVLTGIEAMETVLLKTFDKHGIKKIEPMDEPFNPNFHEVMFESPGTGKPAGTIIQIIEPGYVLHDRLLKPARVGIAKDEGQGSAPSTGDNIDTQA